MNGEVNMAMDYKFVRKEVTINEMIRGKIEI